MNLDRVVVVPISSSERILCERFARSAEIGGQSSVRDAADRLEQLRVDQIVGQIATLAGTKSLYGNALGHYAYRVGRWAADRAPNVGDGGSDIPGSNVDFKGSLIRDPERPRSRYVLAVRPRERHRGTVYVLALVPPELDRVYLCGWAVDEELPEPETDGVFAGASTIVAANLHPWPPFKWSV